MKLRHLYFVICFLTAAAVGFGVSESTGQPADIPAPAPALRATPPLVAPTAVEPATRPPASSPVVAAPDTVLIDYNEADLQNVIRTIATKTGINLIVNKESLEAESVEVRIYTLNYAKADTVRKTLEPVLTRQGKLQVDTRSNTLALSDTPSNLLKLMPLLEKLDTQTPQVMIEDRFVETTKGPNEDLGIGLDWLGSEAFDISGSQQVGYGQYPSTGNDHALLWSGTAASAVNLNPSGYTASVPLATSGSREVGRGATGYNDHALMWSGTTAGDVALNPSGFIASLALGISGNQEVGSESGPGISGAQHAQLWSGTAAHTVDPQSFPPTDYTTSVAYGIDANRSMDGERVNVFTRQQQHPTFLVVIPEPPAFMLAGLGFAGLLLFRRHKRG